MKKKTIRYQAVLFGTFNFPADPDTTVKLMTTFAPLGFIPQVMSVPDPMSGMTAQRMGLTKGSDIRIQFSPDRIDFLAMMPSGNIDDFVKDVGDYAGKLENGSLRFNRISLVIDTLIEEMSRSESEELRNKFLPKSPTNSIDWLARWAAPYSEAAEQYNVCFEAMSANGLMMVINGRMQPLSGVKVMHDVSTTHTNTNPRFEISHLPSVLAKLNEIILTQEENTQV